MAVTVLSVPQPVAAGQVTDEISALLDALVEGESQSQDVTSLDAAALIPRFYQMRGFEPAWGDDASAEALFAELQRGIAQGFKPSDFHLPRLTELRERARSGGAVEQAVFDVFATDAAVKLIHQLVFGKVDPAQLDKAWNFSKPVIEQDTAAVLQSYVDGQGFDALMREIDIGNAQYTMLIDALAKYRDLAAQGDWPLVPEDNVLKPGMVDPAVAAVRARLAREGVLSQANLPASSDAETDPAWIYDEALQEDVKAFQARHGLEADGVIGGRTFASLNRTVEDRINQIRLSLERGRWLMRTDDEEFVIVNIAAPRTYLVKSDGTLWATRSITGSAYRKTPVFRDEIEYMEFNPTWTVPASIFRKDKLPRIRKDPGYLSRNNYVVRNSSGQPVSAGSVNWGAQNPGVTLVQKPGPDNALGLVKFMFPNDYAVYLHDTNDRSLFDRNERNLSSGCVRIEYPFEFANLLMEGDPDWSQERMQAILDSGKTTRVQLPKPMPVMLTYWTAWVQNGQVHFREDPYGRDGLILEALDR